MYQKTKTASVSKKTKNRSSKEAMQEKLAKLEDYIAQHIKQETYPESLNEAGRQLGIPIASLRQSGIYEEAFLKLQDLVEEGRSLSPTRSSQSSAGEPPVVREADKGDRKKVAEAIQWYRDQGTAPESLAAIATRADVPVTLFYNKAFPDLRRVALLLISVGKEGSFDNVNQAIRDHNSKQLRKATAQSKAQQVYWRKLRALDTGTALDTRPGGLDAYPLVNARDAVKMA